MIRTSGIKLRSTFGRRADDLAFTGAGDLHHRNQILLQGRCAILNGFNGAGELDAADELETLTLAVASGGMEAEAPAIWFRQRVRGPR